MPEYPLEIPNALAVEAPSIGDPLVAGRDLRVVGHWRVDLLRVVADHSGGREPVLDVHVFQYRQPDVPHVALALRAPARLPRRLDRGQQESDQQTNDGDHDQQFNQLESPGTSRLPVRRHLPTSLRKASYRIPSVAAILITHRLNYQ
jgi:hypothetical protein